MLISKLLTAQGGLERGPFRSKTKLDLFFFFHSKLDCALLTRAVFAHRYKSLPGLRCHRYYWWFSRQNFSVYPGSPGTQSVQQAGFELRDLPMSVSQVLELKMYATLTWVPIIF